MFFNAESNTKFSTTASVTSRSPPPWFYGTTTSAILSDSYDSSSAPNDQVTSSRRWLASRHLVAHHVNGWAHRSGLVMLLSLRNTSQDSPTRHCSVVEPIACLSAITSPHLLYQIFYTESSIPNPTLQCKRILLQLLLMPTLQTARLIGIMARHNNQSAWDESFNNTLVSYMQLHSTAFLLNVSFSMPPITIR